MHITIPTAGDSSVGQLSARFKAPRYRFPPILLLPFLLLGYLLIAHAFPEELSSTQVLSSAPPPLHRRFLARLRTRFRHTSTPSKLGFFEKDGYFYYSGNAPLVDVTFPQGTRLHPVFPSRSSGQHLSHPPSRLYENEPTSLKSGLASSEDQLHPITALIRDAETKWHALLKRQSRTLEEAVEEYERRYKRPPPLGFDAWWEFATDNSVVLVDEYDQINEDIEPFLSFEPPDLMQQIIALVKDGGGRIPQHSVWAIEIKDGDASILRMPTTNLHRAYEYLRVIQRFAADLPDMLIPFSIEDGPSVLVSGEQRQRHVDYARAGRKLTLEQQQEHLVDHGFAASHWAETCKPNSPIRRLQAGLLAGESPVQPSFISTEHFDASDACKHGSDIIQHGTTLTGGYTPSKLFPVISFSKTTMHSDILATPLDQWSMETGFDPAWEDKSPQVLWRGSTTGIWHSQAVLWKSSHRPRLVALTNDDYDRRTIHFADPLAGDAVRSFDVPNASINEYLFDVAFHPQPLQCSQFEGADETCAAMAAGLRFQDLPMPFHEQNSFKYMLDIDGNAWSGRFHRLMSTRSLIFKSTMYPEWWSKRVMPWYHYVPIKNDYSDLHHAATYFIGLPDGTGSHDNVAKRLGEQGKEWAENHWREEDMAAYQFRLYLELARAVYGVDGSHDFALKR